ncbi:MAG: tRNA pseudouridine(13) synthase TruD [Pseudomonadota bacterium]
MLPTFSLDFPYAYGHPDATADFRTEPEDFQVYEHLGFVPGGEGEHVYLQISKRGENTAWVAEKIAALAQVLVMDVGYCGRKDRHAITTQWFSVYLPKVDVEPQWSALNSDSIQVLQVIRHQHKLRRGDHESNQFVIRLRNFIVADKTAFAQKINQVLAQGVPNYFGEQRFGRNANNLPEAHAVLVEGKRIRDKQKRGLFLSAARSYLFNQVVAARVLAENWQILLDGEPDAVPTAPLWGRGRSAASGEAAQFEESVIAHWGDWCDGLEHAGLQQERRALILKPESASWRWLDDDIELSFSLGSGEFATTILRELAVLSLAIKAEDKVL